MKCSICKKNVDETFLNKIKGTYVKVKGKKKPVCQKCQLKNKDVGEKLRQVFK